MVDRSLNVGASEVAALFGMHPYLTARELYHLKRKEIPEMEDNPILRRGRVLEKFVAELYGQEYPEDKILFCQEQVMTSMVAGLAATPDYLNIDNEPREFKTTKFFKGVALESHQIQLQAQMMCLGAKKGRLVYYDMVGDSFSVFDQQADATIQGLIVKAISKFWSAVKAETPPAVVAEDAEVLTKLFKSKMTGAVLELTGDNELSDALARWESAKAAVKAAESEVDLIKAIIADKIKDNAGAVCGDFTITRNVIEMKERINKAHTQVRLNVKNRRAS